MKSSDAESALVGSTAVKEMGLKDNVRVNRSCSNLTEIPVHSLDFS